MAALVLDKVAKSFGATAVIHDVDLAVADGEFTVFVGPSGCGKSTLLRLICGLEEASSGEIRIDGKRVNEVPAADRGLAMVFQSYALYPHMSVRQNMAFGLENVRTPKAEIETRVGKAATLLRLDGLLDRRPTELSGGQRQRVAIGRAIVREPRMFLFDEPLSNLDAELRVSMRSELVALHRRLRTTMIYVTHDQVEAMTMADRIVVLRAGRVEQAGRPLELYNAPANRFVAGFIGSPQMNFLPVTLAGREGRAARVALPGGGELVVAIDAGTLAPGAPLALGVRPEHLRPSGDAGTIVLAVDEVEQLGGSSQLHGRLGDGATRAIVAVAGQTTARRGQSIPLAVMPDHVHLFDEAGAALPRLVAP